MENPVIFASTAVAQDVRSKLCCAQSGAEFHVGEQNSYPLAPRIIPLTVEDSAVASFW